MPPLGSRTSSRAYWSAAAAAPAFCFFFLAALSSLLGACSSQLEARQVVAPSPVSAHPQEGLSALRRALDHLVQQLREGEQTAGVSPSSLEVRLSAAQKDVVWLERRAPGWPASAALHEFVAAISAHVQLLDEVRDASSAEAEPLLDAVVRDLQVKARQCRRFGGPVPVSISVVTRDAKHQEITGYEVWYVRKAYERRPAAFRRFEQNSSPARRVFQEAGYYVLWAEPPAALGQAGRGARLDVEVGAEQLDQVVDLSVPVLSVEPAPSPVPREARVTR